MPFETINIS